MVWLGEEGGGNLSCGWEGLFGLTEEACLLHAMGHMEEVIPIGQEGVNGISGA